MSVQFSCVVDQNPKYAYQAVVWAGSLLSYGGQSADSLVIHYIDELAPGYQQIFGAWGIETRRVKRFDLRHGFSNKLAQLESSSLHAADHIVLCDCDIAFCGSISPWLQGSSLRSRLAAHHCLSGERWVLLFREAHLDLPPSRMKALLSNGDTIPAYFNGGIYIIPQPIFQRLREAWPRWTRWVLDRPQLIRPYFADQISFAMACVDLGLSIDHLPMELNFSTDVLCADLYKHTGKSDIEPLVLHYHRLDPDGLLLPSQMEALNRQIGKINALIAGYRSGALGEFALAPLPA